MSFTSSHLSRVWYDNAAGTLTDVSAFVTSVAGVDFTRASLDTTSLNDAAMTAILGLRGGQTVTLSGNYHATMHTQAIAIEALNTGATQTVRYSPAGTGTGAPFVSVETILESYTVSSSVNGLVTYTLTLKATGAATTGTH